MIRIARYSFPALACCLAATAPARAEEPAPTDGLHPAAGMELFMSTDAEKTDVVKLLGRALWNFEGRDKYQGIAVEKAWFKPLGQHAREKERAYIDLADRAGDKWLWSARIGTDGDTVIGSVNVRTADWKQNYFIERDMIETPQGVDRGIYYTFVGAGFDFPLDERNVFTAMGGVQAFTGTNERLHLRGSYIHVLKPEWGLSAQLRGRYFHSTTPREYDYFSPKDYVEILPVVQLRRYTKGWMYQLAGGYGAQHATGTTWQDSRYASLRVESPARSRSFNAFLDVQYTNTSVNGGLNYDYVMGRVGLTIGF